MTMYAINIDNLENCFRSAIDSNYNYVAVKICMEGFEIDEIIVNPIENAEAKLKYYKDTYKDDLTHKYAGDKIRIVGCTFGDSLADIEEDFYDYNVASKVILNDGEDDE